jgi:hypothetical protein
MADQEQGNLPVPVGKKQYSPDEADAILANMQKIIDERSGPLNTFVSGLKDATAWTGGGIEGPTATLATRDRQKQSETENMLKMQKEMAEFKAGQEAQRQFAEEQRGSYGGGFGGVANAPSAGAGAAAGTNISAGQPSGTTYKGVPIDMETAVAMRQAPTRGDRDKIFNDFVSNLAKNRQQFQYSAPSYNKSVEIKVPDGKGGFKLEMVSPLEAKQMQDSGQGTIVPQQTTPTTAPRVGTGAIAKVETGGREGLVSPKGAMGVMQVMPNTNRDPGFGVAPAKDNSETELKRVGEEYYGAMQKKYGNDTLAAIAYNMGPGKTDSWLSDKKGDFNALPKETQNYIGKVHLAQAQLDRQPGVSGAAAEVVKPISEKTIPEIKLEMELAKREAEKDIAIAQAQGVGEATKRGEEFATQATALESAYSNAGERKNSVEYIRNQMANTNVIGILSKPTVAAALGTLLKEGFDVGSSKTSVNGLDQAIAQAMRGSDPKDIAAMQNIGREFAKMELTESRNYLKGQGAVSDAERRLITRIVASVGTSPEAIKDYLKITEMRANFDEKAGKAWEDFQTANPKASYNTFRLQSEEFKNIKKEYLAEIKGFTQSTLQPKQPAAGAAPHPGASLVDKYLKR